VVTTSVFKQVDDDDDDDDDDERMNFNVA